MYLPKRDAGEGSWGLQARGVELVKDSDPPGSKENTPVWGSEGSTRPGFEPRLRFLPAV